MTQTIFAIIAAVFGLIFGSFAGATVWRIRARQILNDKKNGEAIDATELKRLTPLAKRTLKDDRSQCLHCGHELRWYDLLPLVSWLSTSGKCRYCKKPIGFFEPVMELLTASLFVIAYVSAPAINSTIEASMFALVLVIVVLLVILAAYDLKWYLLPDVVVVPLIAMSVIYALLRILNADEPVNTLFQTVLAVAIFSGIYYLLYLYSKYKSGEEHTWVGFGDVKLNLGLGLLLGSWQTAFLALFLANFIGVLVVVPALIMKKTGLKSQIPFGPLLILGFFIAFFFGQGIIDGYVQFNANLATWLAALML